LNIGGRSYEFWKGTQILVKSGFVVGLQIGALKVRGNFIKILEVRSGLGDVII